MCCSVQWNSVMAEFLLKATSALFWSPIPLVLLSAVFFKTVLRLVHVYEEALKISNELSRVHLLRSLPHQRVPSVCTLSLTAIKSELKQTSKKQQDGHVESQREKNQSSGSTPPCDGQGTKTVRFNSPFIHFPLLTTYSDQILWDWYPGGALPNPEDKPHTLFRESEAGRPCWWAPMTTHWVGRVFKR